MISDTDFAILKSKLKRNQIDVRLQDGKLQIGKAGTDHFTLYVNVVLPLALLLISLFAQFGGFGLFVLSPLLIGIMFLLVGIAVQGLMKLNSQKKANTTQKVIGPGEIRLQDADAEIVIANPKSSDFYFEIKDLGIEGAEEMIGQKGECMGSILIKDGEGNPHQILAVVDGKKTHLEKELKWISKTIVGHCAGI